MESYEKALQCGKGWQIKSVSAQSETPFCENVLSDSKGHSPSCGYSGTFEYKYNEDIHHGNRKNSQTKNSGTRTAEMLKK